MIEVEFDYEDYYAALNKDGGIKKLFLTEEQLIRLTDAILEWASGSTSTPSSN